MEGNLTVKEIKALIPHGGLIKLAKDEGCTPQYLSKILNKEMRTHRLWPKILGLTKEKVTILEKAKREEKKIKKTLETA